MAIKDIVTVNITRQTTSVAVAAFNVPLILSTFATSKTTTAFTRARSYGSLKALTDDGWASTDAVYKMAQAIFAQNPSVNRIVVGRADSGDATVADSLAAIQAEDNSWYGLAVDQAFSDSDKIDIAAWVEANKRFGFYWTTDADVPDATKNTDMASVLKGLGYDRAATMWHPTPATGADYPDAAWMGEGFPFEPGSSTWAYKTLKGVTPDNVDTKETTLQNKNCNYYSTVGGVNITQEGRVASGEWIDIIIGTDWIEARLREAVYGAFVNNRKISYDDRGITTIEGLVKGVLSQAAAAGILQADSIVVTVPKYKDVPQADKLARKLPDVKFTALYQGAIQRTTINGTISV